MRLQPCCTLSGLADLASSTSARDVRWLLWPDGHGSGAGSLEDVFSQGPSAASIETLQRFATWTTKADPRSLLNQLALASSAIVMARGLGYEGPEATKEQKLQVRRSVVSRLSSV